MYAIIETGGKQYWVEPGEIIKVEKLAVEKGQELTFKALWSAPGAKESPEGAVDKAAAAAMPAGEAGSRGGTVTAEVIGAMREKKIIVFKKRTKKAYKKTQGHRQHLTRIQIKTISLN